MKRLFLTFLSLLIGLQTLFAQSISQDALQLASYLQGDSLFVGVSGNDLQFTDYLRRYLPEESRELLTDAELRDYYIDNNPFIGPMLNRGGASSLPENLRLPGGGFNPASLRRFNVTTLADGFAQFLIEKARVELAMSLFRSFQRELDRRYELAVLFPETRRVLQTIDVNVNSFDSYVMTVRTAFRSDLSNGLNNVSNLLRSEPYADRFKSPVLHVMAIEGLPVAQLLISGEHPAAVLDRLSSAFAISEQPELAGIQHSLQLVNLISQSLWDNQAWIGREDMKHLLTGHSGRTFQIYLGLVFEQGRDLVFVRKAAYSLNNLGLSEILGGDVPRVVQSKLAGMRIDEPISLTGFDQAINEALGSNRLDADARERLIRAAQVQEEGIRSLREVLQAFLNEGRLDDLRGAVESFLYEARQVQQAFDDFREMTETAGYDDYFRLSRTAIDLLRSGLAFRNAFIGASADEEALQLLTMLDALSTLALSIEQKNYTTIVIGMTALLTEVIAPDFVDRFKGVVLRYGSLVAGLAEAETPDEVQMALEAAALPPGSATLKKQNVFSVALGAYVGGFFGSEFLRDPPGYDVQKTAGVTLPIGLSFSAGLSSRDRGAITLFLPLVDIGAFGAFRLSDRFAEDNYERLPAVQLKNIFAPGGYVAYDFPRAPISIGFGFQFGPNVREFRRELTQDGILIVRPESTGGYRWSGFLAMDLPLLNLYTKYR